MDYKYLVVFKKILILDEWVFLTSGHRLIENKDDVIKFRRYIAVVEKCKEG